MTYHVISGLSESSHIYCKFSVVTFYCVTGMYSSNKNMYIVCVHVHIVQVCALCSSGYVVVDSYLIFAGILCIGK